MAAYIDLNPVRAGMVKDPADYRWSSYGAAMGGEKAARNGLQTVVNTVVNAGSKQRTVTDRWLERYRPEMVWVADVVDRANARLQYFTLDGLPLKVVQGVSFPAHFDIRGDVLLVADLHARLTLMDKENKVITHLGYDPEWTKKVLDGFKMRSQPATWTPGRFIHPHDACFSHQGDIFVAEWVSTGRITRLKKV